MALSSMTGFGAATCDGVSVEVRSVNHRYLDLQLRLPRECNPLEAEVRAAVARRLARGRVDLSVRLEEAAGDGVLRVDRDTAERYLDALRHLHSGDGVSHGISHSVDLAALLALPGVLVPRQPEVGAEALGARLLEAVDRACVQAAAVRREEGAALQAEMTTRLATVSTAVARLRLRAPLAVRAAGERLRERVAALAGEAGVDPVRLAQEAAILADRADVTEEITRLESHLEQFRAALDATEAVGRHLDFLLVEMNREANTTGAKCQDAEMTLDVVLVKGEIEKLREQAQNVE